MFCGTTIDELLEIVERAEGHAQPSAMLTMEMKMENPEAMYPAFLTELLQANLGMAGVA